MPTDWPSADPEFLLRRETRGIRFQLEMLKPDLDQQDAGIENTVVVLRQRPLSRARRCGQGARRSPCQR